MSADRDRTAGTPDQDSTSDRPPRSPNRRPVALLPPDFVPLDAQHERQALDVLADMLADYLDRPGVHRDPDRP